MIILKSLIKEVISPSSLKSVLEKGYGWVSVRGQFYVVDKFTHFSIIQKLPISNELKGKIDSWVDDLKDVGKSCEDLADAGEHPEWHCYEMTEDSIRDDIIKSMYEEGWIRFGRNVGRNMWEFEGFPKPLKDRLSVIRKFKNQLDPDVKVQITPRQPDAKDPIEPRQI